MLFSIDIGATGGNYDTPNNVAKQDAVHPSTAYVTVAQNSKHFMILVVFSFRDCES